ncbi:MAG: hypothetical protein GXP42_00480 [Chloroflexi bacterium]|nr:hypothetical protein [Chloroflexota bacterium]
MNRFLWLSLFSLFAFSLLAPGVAAQEPAITISATTIRNQFPSSLSFETEAISRDGEIIKAELVFYLDNLLGLDNLNRRQIEFEPGKKVTLAYTWDTDGITTPPFAPVVFYWVVTDSTGAKLQTEPQRVFYEDVRFRWKKLEDERISVWWYDKPKKFGRQVFALAQKAVERQRQLFGADLEHPIRIVIYGTLEDFQAWHGVPTEWAGGLGFPAFGITTQVVKGKRPDKAWLNDVIPHEISHLYFEQVAGNPAAPAPTWLNEGVAQYNEFQDQRWIVEEMREVAKEGQLIPLVTLTAGFGRSDETRVRLAYKESYSAVVYLIETYGQEGLARLLAAYKAGKAGDDAFEAALGVSMGQFDLDWAEWLGAPPGSLVTPTPWVYPTPEPPTPLPFYQKTRTPSPTRASVSSPTLTPSPSPTLTPIPSPTRPFTPSPTPTPLPSTALSQEIPLWLPLACCFGVLSILLALGGLLLIVLLARKAS